MSDFSFLHCEVFSPYSASKVLGNTSPLLAVLAESKVPVRQCMLSSAMIWNSDFCMFIRHSYNFTSVTFSTATLCSRQPIDMVASSAPLPHSCPLPKKRMLMLPLGLKCNFFNMAPMFLYYWGYKVVAACTSCCERSVQQKLGMLSHGSIKLC